MMMAKGGGEGFGMEATPAGCEYQVSVIKKRQPG
jgi:hypothetical protein